VDARFRERDAGDWTGLTRHEIEAGWPRYLADHRRPGGFEHDRDVLARIIEGLVEVHATHPGETVLIVSHGGVLRALERYCHDVDRAFPNVGGRIFELDGEAGTAGDLAITAGPRLFPLDDGQATYTTTP
jgi:probable phosphoglycerate mutase